MNRIFHPLQAIGLALALSVSNGFASPADGNLETPALWFNEPARDWNQALPLGNAHLGAMIHGETKTERSGVMPRRAGAAGAKNDSRPTKD